MQIKFYTQGNYGEGFASYAFTDRWLAINGNASEIVDVRWTVRNPAVLEKLHAKFPSTK